ncbi:MAG: phospholipase D-like domain-containing protein [Candidatus Methanospirareceae archaeon]
MSEKGVLSIERFAGAVILVLFVLLILTPIIAAQYRENEARVLITELYPDTAMRNELDEYVAVTNFGANMVNLDGWSLTDTEGTLIYPAFELAPYQTLYVTRNASAFMAHRGAVVKVSEKPDFEYGPDSDPAIPQLQTSGMTFALRNTGDEVILVNDAGEEVDAVIYGECSYTGEGWHGAPLEKPREGMILTRKGARDSDRSNDWLALPLGASYHEPTVFSCSGEVTAFVSPDCSFSALQRELDAATSSIYLNLYQFEHRHLMDALGAAVDRGVAVKLLLESNPVGGVTADERYSMNQALERGLEVRLAEDPYINHAKYAVVDNRTLIVMTENWKLTGVPVDNSYGNRGWGIVIRAKDVASYFTALFFEDFYRGSAVTADILDAGTSSTVAWIPQGNFAAAFEPVTVAGEFIVIPVVAPDSALDNETILGTIRNAEERIYVQQFSAPRFWGKDENIFITALIAAARRGCEVKVLLDANDYNLETVNDNDEVVAWLEQVAHDEDLNLAATLANLDELGVVKVHTKALIVDGQTAVITSLNWNGNSVQNREVGVIVDSEAVAAFYEAVFLHDWNASVKYGSVAGSRARAAPTGDSPLSSVKTKGVGIAVTLIITVLIFGLVKWYKRL